MFNLVYKTSTCTLHGNVCVPDSMPKELVIKVTAEAWGVKEYDLCDWTIEKITVPEAMCALVY